MNRITLPLPEASNRSARTIRARAYALSDRLDPSTEHAREMLRAFDLDLDFDLCRDVDRDFDRGRAGPGSAALEWACSGAMMLTGSPDGPPEFANGPLASAAKGAALTLETLAPGSGFATIDAPALLGERAAIDGLARRGNISVGGSARLLATSGGGLALNLPRAEDWQLIPALLETGHRELASSRDWKLLAKLVADRNLKELVERGRIMGLAIAPLAPPSMSPLRPTTTSDRHPLLDLRHATETEALARRSRRRRLLDLSSLWAGPLATSLLAIAGIDVLKVESPTRPDGARGGSKRFFDLMNGNKRGCALDLRDAADRSIFEQLLDAADIVVESARPRALSQLGFDASSWVSDRPGRIWASITGYGRTREWIAFGDDAAVAAGLAWAPAPGASASNPRFCGDAIADPLGGLHAAVAILALLEKGRGGLLDLSLVDIAAYAAAIENDGLVLPVEVASEGWCVIEDARRVSIEKPRARTSDRIAPKLEAPNAALISEWTRPC